jgi:hypothetical protein
MQTQWIVRSENTPDQQPSFADLFSVQETKAQIALKRNQMRGELLKQIQEKERAQQDGPCDFATSGRLLKTV